jgi:hypothetical protein
MYKVLLKETENLIATIVDFEDIVAFNEKEIRFKCGARTNCCKEWFEQLKNVSIVLWGKK